MQRIILAGNGIAASNLLPHIAADDRYQIVGVTADDEFVASGGLDGFETIPLSLALQAFPPTAARVIMAIGYGDLNRVRESVFGRIKHAGYAVETFVHPSAYVSRDAVVGEGCLILPGAVVEPGVTVGVNSVVWSNVTLAHDCQVAEHCWIAAGTVVSGHARIHRNTFVGVNATIVNDVTVGEYSLVGAAAFISRNTRPHSVYLARSAEPLRFSAEEYAQHFKV
jgi:sugar O-acyltransferase (sialic acid O-acetyltransferase NeuD family)